MSGRDVMWLMEGKTYSAVWLDFSSDKPQATYHMANCGLARPAWLPWHGSCRSNSAHTWRRWEAAHRTAARHRQDPWAWLSWAWPLRVLSWFSSSAVTRHRRPCASSPWCLPQPLGLPGTEKPRARFRHAAAAPDNQSTHHQQRYRRRYRPRPLSRPSPPYPAPLGPSGLPLSVPSSSGLVRSSFVSTL